MAFDAERIIPPGANIKVIGVGGGGGNAVNTMIRSHLEGVEFIAANTDVQALRFALPEKKIQIGKELTKGLGAGADPDIGRDAALEDRHEIQEALNGADMVFITAGMGGGTGTGGASVIAQIARELGALTVAVVTKPFNFEGKRRRKHADMGIDRLRESVDTLITIPNQRLLQIATPDLSMVDAFRMADAVLVNAVRGISDIINIPGTVNVDFADVKTVMSSMGLALMGIGRASGQNRAVEAARQAICSPLLEDIDIEGATGILINITASSNLSLMEVNEACSIIQEAAHEDANIIFGAVIDETAGDELRVTVIATGFPAEFEQQDLRDDHMGAQPHFSQRRPLTVNRPSSFSARFDSSARITSPHVSPAPKTTQTHFQSSLRSSSVSSSSPTNQPITQQSFRPDPSFHAPSSSASFNAPSPAPHIASNNPFLSNEAHGEVEDLTRMTFEHRELRVEQETITTSTSSEESAFIPGFDLKPHHDHLDHHPVVSSEPHTSDELISDEHELEAALSATEPAPLESLFQKSEREFDEISSSFDRKLNEALKLAERLKGASAQNPSSQQARDEDEEDLNVPAFMRGGIHDLSLD